MLIALLGRIIEVCRRVYISIVILMVDSAAPGSMANFIPRLRTLAHRLAL